VTNAAGLPGVRFRISARGNRGSGIESTITTLYEGRRQFVFSCTTQPANAVEMAAGCQQALASFEPS
jgi:hypothetical protein